MTCPLWAIVKMTAVFCLVLFCVFSTFLLVLRAFSSRPLAYKGRAHCIEASWYLAASQAVITSNYRSVITLSTRDFWSQFLWLLPPTGDKATYVVFLCDHAIVTGIVTAWNVIPVITPLTLIYQLNVPNQNLEPRTTHLFWSKIKNNP